MSMIKLASVRLWNEFYEPAAYIYYLSTTVRKADCDCSIELNYASAAPSRERRLTLVAAS
ncbi:MAG: hypothetical protein ABNH26_05810 [Celeribacter sp.]|jgi:hypothetical protein